MFHFISGVTHKKTIIEYCENKKKYAIYNKDIIDTDSYILMWELLILLIRQNGVRNKEKHMFHQLFFLLILDGSGNRHC